MLNIIDVVTVTTIIITKNTRIQKIKTKINMYIVIISTIIL